MKTKPALFLDFDEVLVSTRAAMVRFLKHQHGVTIPDGIYLCGHGIESIIHSYLPKGFTLELGHQNFYEHLGTHFAMSEYWHGEVSPIEGATDVIPELSKKYDLWVATARQVSSKKLVEKLLGRFFPNHIQGVHCAWEHLGNGRFEGKPKRDFVSEFSNAHAFIDDNPIEIKAMLGVVPSFLFDPTGHHDRVTDIPNRVGSWKEIARTFL